MDDYVGPTRFQYPEKAIHIVNEIRDELPHKYLKSQYHDGQYFGHYINCDPNIFETALNDPSENEKDVSVLNTLLERDKNYAQSLDDMSLYAVALAIK